MQKNISEVSSWKLRESHMWITAMVSFSRRVMESAFSFKFQGDTVYSGTVCSKNRCMCCGYCRSHPRKKTYNTAHKRSLAMPFIDDYLGQSTTAFYEGRSDRTSCHHCSLCTAHFIAELVMEIRYIIAYSQSCGIDSISAPVAEVGHAWTTRVALFRNEVIT